MHDHVKARLVSAVDALAKRGLAADRVAVHPDTAAEYAISGTHVDLSSEALLPDAEALVDEMSHRDYDPQRAVKMSAELTGKLASEAARSHLRREVVLEVLLDPAVARGRLAVSGIPIERCSEEV